MSAGVAPQPVPNAPCGYRPRQAFQSPLWRIVCDHQESFLSTYESRCQATHGPLRPEIEKFLREFSFCGDPNEGLTLFFCRECGVTLAVPFSCKNRACPSCVARRAEDVASHLQERLPLVAHRHVVISLPKKMGLRQRILEDRGLFRRLARIVVAVLRRHMVRAVRVHRNRREELKDARPGIVMAQHSFGDRLNWHPHWHVVVSDGVFLADGDFYTLFDWQPQLLHQALRTAILKAFVRWEKLTPQAADTMAGWEPERSGFNVYIGPTIVEEDREGLQRLLRYLFRSPVSFQKLGYDEPTGRVRCQLDEGGFHEWEHALAYLADLSLHIPQARRQTVTYAGQYANATGILNQAPPARGHQEKPAPAPGPRRWVPWARLVARCWKVDPELCPRCGPKMRRTKAILERLELVRLLKALGRYGYAPRPPPVAPPSPGVEQPDGDLPGLEFEVSQIPPGWDDWTD